MDLNLGSPLPSIPLFNLNQAQPLPYISIQQQKQRQPSGSYLLPIANHDGKNTFFHPSNKHLKQTQIYNSAQQTISIQQSYNKSFDHIAHKQQATKIRHMHINNSQERQQASSYIGYIETPMETKNNALKVRKLGNHKNQPLRNNVIVNALNRGYEQQNRSISKQSFERGVNMNRLSQTSNMLSNRQQNNHKIPIKLGQNNRIISPQNTIPTSQYPLLNPISPLAMRQSNFHNNRNYSPQYRNKVRITYSSPPSHQNTKTINPKPEPTNINNMNSEQYECEEEQKKQEQVVNHQQQSEMYVCSDENIQKQDDIEQKPMSDDYQKCKNYDIGIEQGVDEQLKQKQDDGSHRQLQKIILSKAQKSNTANPQLPTFSALNDQQSPQNQQQQIKQQHSARKQSEQFNSFLQQQKRKKLIRIKILTNMQQQYRNIKNQSNMMDYNNLEEVVSEDYYDDKKGDAKGLYSEYSKQIIHNHDADDNNEKKRHQLLELQIKRLRNQVTLMKLKEKKMQMHINRLTKN